MEQAWKNVEADVSGKRSQGIGDRGERDVRKLLCEAFDVPHDKDLFPRAGRGQGGLGKAPDVGGFPWFIEVKAGKAAFSLHLWTKTARDIHLKAEHDSTVAGDVPAVVIRKASPGVWMVACWQWLKMGDDEHRCTWVEIPFDDWADLELGKQRIKDWRDKVFYDE